MKYESGVHRVRRVPKTESQAAFEPLYHPAVAVLPEADEIIQINQEDLRIDTYCASALVVGALILRIRSSYYSCQQIPLFSPGSAFSDSRTARVLYAECFVLATRWAWGRQQAEQECRASFPDWPWRTFEDSYI